MAVGTCPHYTCKYIGHLEFESETLKLSNTYFMVVEIGKEEE